MAKLLCLKASPRGTRSVTTTVIDAFLEKYRQQHPDDIVTEKRLFESGLPAFDAVAAMGKYAIIHGEEPTVETRRAWERVEALITEFLEHDKYVFGVPMWNFGLPYALKHYLDIVIQPSYTFNATPDGYEGLVVGKKALTVYASGGDYGPMPELDHQQPYLKRLLNFIGIHDIVEIVVAPTLAGGGEVARARMDEAVARARALALAF